MQDDKETRDKRKASAARLSVISNSTLVLLKPSVYLWFPGHPALEASFLVNHMLALFLSCQIISTYSTYIRHILP